MPSRGLSESQVRTKQTRSRNGCFTCKVRKVRCIIDHPAKEETALPVREPGNACSNCERLGLGCRWDAPAPGERYVPPPKRRRTNVPPQNVGQDDRQLPCEHEPGLTAQRDTVIAQPRASNDEPSLANTDQNMQPLFGPLDPLFTVDFDMDMHTAFDGLEYMLPTSHFSEPLQGIQSSSHDELRALPAVIDENRHLIQHYIDVLQGYSKVTDRPKEPNLFVSAFSESLSFPPLFHSILSFSSAHLAMNDASYAQQAELYDDLSTRSLDAFSQQPHLVIEGLLSAIFIHVKKEHVTASGIDRFLSLMQLATDILTGEQGHTYLENISELGRRTIVRLCVLDARAALYRQGGGQFVRRMRNTPALSDLFPSIIRLDYAADGIMCLLQVGLLRMQAADIESRLYQQLTSEYVGGPPIRLDEIENLYMSYQSHIDQWDAFMNGHGGQKSDLGEAGTPSTLDAVSYRDQTVLAALHSMQLYLHLIFPLPHWPIDRSVSTILRCEMVIQGDASRANSPASILPSSLFLAGVCTQDSIYTDWVLKTLERGESWGAYIRKAGVLVKEMVKSRRGGYSVDVHSAMERSTGLFLI